MGPEFEGKNTLEFTISELLWAAITVGRKNILDVIQHGVFSDYEILYRAAMVVSNLGLDRHDRIIKSPAYKSLDPSEKGAVSYFLGLTFSKLIAAKRLNCGWLMHLDVYREQLEEEHGMILGEGNSRPDMVGRDVAGRYYVFESKGRTHKMDGGLLERAKRQTEHLERFGRRRPYLRVAVVTHFAGDRLILDWADPEFRKQGKKLSIKTTDEEYFQYYYSMVYNLLADKSTRRMGDYLVYDIEAVDLRIGLHREIYEAFPKSQIAKTNFGKLASVENSFNLLLDEDNFVGSDGILIGAGNSWLERLNKSRRNFK